MKRKSSAGDQLHSSLAGLLICITAILMVNSFLGGSSELRTAQSVHHTPP